MVAYFFASFYLQTQSIFLLTSSSSDKCELTPSIHFSPFNLRSNSEIPIVKQDLIDINETNIFIVNYHRLRC